jgi:hypothetical protein
MSSRTDNRSTEWISRATCDSYDPEIAREIELKLLPLPPQVDTVNPKILVIRNGKKMLESKGI